MAILKRILEEHFDRHNAANSSTRVIVFAELRSTVDSIIEELNDLKASGVRASPFVGQSSGSSNSNSGGGSSGTSNAPIAQGKKGQGLTQKEQARVLAAFNAGEINTLIATCIAEEGLDIAEVDLIVLFEAIVSPTRLTQRMGMFIDVNFLLFCEHWRLQIS